VSTAYGGSRLRAYLEFIAAILYFFVARSFAQRIAGRLWAEAWSPLGEQAILAFLLVAGYAAFGFLIDRQTKPISAQGLPMRAGWPREAAMGLAVGWTAVVLCVVPMALIGGIAIVISTHAPAWGWLVADFAFFALGALVEEVTFRGYGFQRFERVVGPYGASIGFALFYAILQALLPGTTNISIAVSLILSLLLSMAYLRTRALWMSWGINFGWKASRALVFGLAVSGVNSHSSVVEGDPMGPFWITGGGFGIDGSWIAAIVLLSAFPVVYRITRELDFQYNAPLIVPGGVPVDLEAAARRQHESAMGHSDEENRAPALVQILPAAAPQPPIPASEVSEGRPDDSH
jgi:membrane protease YdiL (CAAX protease family)